MIWAPQRVSHQTGLQQFALGLDVENVSSEFAEIRVVPGVHEHPERREGPTARSGEKASASTVAT